MRTLRQWMGLRLSRLIVAVIVILSVAHPVSAALAIACNVQSTGVSAMAEASSFAHGHAEHGMAKAPIKQHQPGGTHDPVEPDLKNCCGAMVFLEYYVAGADSDGFKLKAEATVNSYTNVPKGFVQALPERPPKS